MKTTTGSLIFCFSFLLLSTISHAQQAEKTLVKSFNLKGNQVVLLDLKGNVEVKEWNNELMRVQITVGLENGTEAMLKSLVQAGRYNLDADETSGDFTVVAPGLQRTVTVRGNQLLENISYTIFAPGKVIVKLLDETSTSKEDVKVASQF